MYGKEGSSGCYIVIYTERSRALVSPLIEIGSGVYSDFGSSNHYRVVIVTGFTPDDLSGDDGGLSPA